MLIMLKLHLWPWDADESAWGKVCKWTLSSDLSDCCSKGQEQTCSIKKTPIWYFFVLYFLLIIYTAQLTKDKKYAKEDIKKIFCATVFDPCAFSLARLDRLAEQRPDGALTGVRSQNNMLQGANIIKVLGSKQRGKL